MDMIFSFLKLSDEMVKTILSLVFNVFFCLMMVLGTMYLSADVMLIIGVTTLFVGPLLVSSSSASSPRLVCAHLAGNKGYTLLYIPKFQKQAATRNLPSPSPSSELIVTHVFLATFLNVRRSARGVGSVAFVLLLVLFNLVRSKLGQAAALG